MSLIFNNSKNSIASNSGSLTISGSLTLENIPTVNELSLILSSEVASLTSSLNHSDSLLTPLSTSATISSGLQNQIKSINTVLSTGNITNVVHISGAETIIGTKTFNAGTYTKLGTSSSYAKTGGTVYVDTNTYASINGIGDFCGYTLPANSFIVDGDSINYIISGSITTNATNKGLYIKIGATTIFDVSYFTTVGVFILNIRLMKISGILLYTVNLFSTETIYPNIQVNSLSVNFASPITISIGGTTSYDEELVVTSGKVIWEPAP